MTRRYARGLRGLRVVDSVPHGHWNTTTFIAGLRYNGLTAPAVFDGAMDRACFESYITQILAPTLQPGDIVIMDNLSCHKNTFIDAAIRDKGAKLLYLLDPVLTKRSPLTLSSTMCWTCSLPQNSISQKFRRFFSKIPPSPGLNDLRGHA